MASSLYVNMHWTTSSTPMLVLLAVIVSTATIAGASPVRGGQHLVSAQAHGGRHRVGRPCAGRHAVENVESVDLPVSTDDENSVSSRHRLRRDVRNVRNLFAALYRDVNQLKADYVSTLRHCNGHRRHHLLLFKNKLTKATKQKLMPQKLMPTAWWHR